MIDLDQIEVKARAAKTVFETKTKLRVKIESHVKDEEPMARVISVYMNAVMPDVMLELIAETKRLRAQIEAYLNG